MRKTSFLFLTASVGIALACSNRLPTSPGNSAQRGSWGSNEASLTINDSSATLQILASGVCFGAYGGIDQPIPTPRFALSGIYTQLIGAFPGSVQYPAQYSGTVEGNQMSIMVSVPALQQAVGPFSLTYGVRNTWVPCQYPRGLALLRIYRHGHRPAEAAEGDTVGVSMA
jgi:hypothetical protein